MSIFEYLKRNKPVATPKAVLREKENGLFFLLCFDDQGAFIETIDKTGKSADFDYRQYSGIVRSLSKTIHTIRSRSHFTIDWQNPDSRLYLHEHPYLIPQLLESSLFINDKHEPIKAGPEPGQMKLALSKTGEKTFSSNLYLTVAGTDFTEFQFINDTHAWLPGSNTVLETEPIGTLFHSLSHFNLQNLPAGDLQKFLSLFFSYLDNVALQYENYDVRANPEPIKSRPALIFEKVDADNSLFLRIGQLMPNTDIDFLDDYDLFRFAAINEMEETITVRPIEQVHIDQHVSLVEKVLKKHAAKGKKKGETGIIREENLLIIPESIASEFIYRDIPDLIAGYALVGSEKLKSYKVNVNPPKLNIQLGHGIDFLEGKAALEFGSQSISLFDAISQFNKTRYIVLSDGSHALVNEAYMQKLQRLFKKKKDKIEISFFDLPLVDELIDARTTGERFNKARDVFEGFNRISDKKARLPAVNAKLRPYQQLGFQWLLYLHQNRLGGCLADDMGLGKTLQAITLLSEVYAKDKTNLPSIVVMPRSLLFNWENELKKFAPHLTFYTWYSANRDRSEARKAHIVLTTYAMLRNDIENWKEEKFLYAILDESQAVKNLGSQLHKSVMLIDASYRLALSGTPVENNLSELYALFRFLNPAMFGSAENFNRNYLSPIQKHNSQEATIELKKKIYPFILRRLKKDVLSELPDKIEQTLYVEMSPEQARYYESRRLYYKEAIEQQVAMKGIQQSQLYIFQALNELRRIASIPDAQTGGKIDSPKTELLIDQLEDAIANRHKVLVFANYLAAVETIGEELDKKGIDFVSMTGSTRNRQQLVERFQNDPNCKVFILTLKTGGTGLNLTAADTVFIFDPWWNKSAENQAIDRAHRIGQNRKVMSYKLVTLGTIEEKILQLQEAKSAMLEAIISSDSASVKSLSEEDIAFILGK